MRIPYVAMNQHSIQAHLDHQTAKHANISWGNNDIKQLTEGYGQGGNHGINLWKRKREDKK